MSYHYHQKVKKRFKRLTKLQILSNILPFYDSVGIVRRGHAHRHMLLKFIMLK